MIFERIKVSVHFSFVDICHHIPGQRPFSGKGRTLISQLDFVGEPLSIRTVQEQLGKMVLYHLGVEVKK